VRDVDPTHRSGDLRELDHFRSRRERAGDVEQTGAEPERAVQHPLPDQPAHLLDLLRRRFPVDRSDDLIAHRPLSDEQRKVGGDVQGCQPLEKRLDRQRRRSIRALDQRRHALAHVVVGRRHVEDPAARVRVDVDEARRHHVSAGVDRPGGGALDSRRDARDRLAAQRDVAAVPRTAGAVDDARVANQEIVGGGLGAETGDQERADENRRRNPCYLTGLHLPLPESRNVLPGMGMNSKS
jgi:hypothetical protein